MGVEMDSNNINNETKNELNSEVAEKNSSQKQSKPKLKQFHRRLLVILAIIIFLIIIGGVIWLVLDKNPNKQTSDKSGEMSLTDVYHRTLAKSEDGDYQQAQKDLDIALEEADDKDKISLLNMKFSIAWNAERYEEAYLLTKELCNAEESFNSYRWLGEASLKIGSISEALDGFKKAQELIVGDDEQASYDRDNIQTKINEIQALGGGVYEN